MRDEEHAPDCYAIIGGWGGDMNARCDCVHGARRALQRAEAREASRASALAEKDRPVREAYDRGRADATRELEARIAALEAMVRR